MTFSLDDATLKADGFDDCIIGVSSKSILVYDLNAIIEKLSADMSREDAVEYFYHNIDCAYVGEFTPIYISLATAEELEEFNE